MACACTSLPRASTIAQLDFLRGAGCDQVQGHVYSRPQTVERIEALLRAGHIEPNASAA
jgi:EAL domain-containing protein (putative c-di-GMP-specific phosphodiesterase class I)